MINVDCSKGDIKYSPAGPELLSVSIYTTSRSIVLSNGNGEVCTYNLVLVLTIFNEGTYLTFKSIFNLF